MWTRCTTLLHDGQGSTRALADESGAITDSYTYDAFGEIYEQSGTTENPYLYTGQQYDDLTGLYSLRARYYNPALGRFLSRDTASVLYDNPLELNRYVYAANNPINASDPTGNQALFERLNLDLNTVKGRRGAGAIGGGVFGGLSAFAIYFMASANLCGSDMKDWAGRVNPALFVSGSIATGAFFGWLTGGLPPADAFLTSSIGATASTAVATLNPNACTALLALVAWAGTAASCAGAMGGGGGTAGGAGAGGGTMSLALEATTANVWVLAASAAAVGELATNLALAATGDGDGDDGGPGEWVDEDQSSWSESARAYQEQVTGKRGKAYEVEDVKFDGYDKKRGVLLEAKDDYRSFINSKGDLYDFMKMNFVEQATRQSRAAGKRPIEWHIADEPVVMATRKLFNRYGFDTITVIHTPNLSR